MTLEEAMFDIAATEWWTARWWRLGKIIVQANGKSWESKRGPDDTAPAGLSALGCGGLSITGRTDWIGYDLDCGHGKNAYTTSEEAIDDARRFARKLAHRCWEVRLSKSGKGVHVRVLLDESLPAGADVKKAAQDLLGRSWLRVDPVVMGRQAMWLHAVGNPQPRQFELIEERGWN